MVFTVSSRDLLRTLNALSKVILKRNTLPILDNVLVSKRDERFFLTASSVEHTLTMLIDLRPTDKEPFQPFCMNVNAVSAVLAALPEQPITLSVEPDTLRTTCTYQGGEFSIPSFSAADYPLPKEISDPRVVFSLPTDILLTAVKSGVACASNSDLRPTMSAVALDVTNEGVTFFATNGQMLYKYAYLHGVPFLTSGQPDTILVPRNIIGALEAPFHGVETVELRHDGKQLVISSPDVTFSIRDIEGKAPNYNSVIPASSPYHIVLPVRELMASLRRVSLMASDASRLIALRRNELFISICAEDIDFSRSAREELTSPDCTLPEGFAIGFSSADMLTVLSAISTENVRIELTAPERAVIFREDAPNSSLLELLMPLKLDA